MNKYIKKYSLLIFIISLIFINGVVYAEFERKNTRNEFRNTINNLKENNKQLTESEKEELKNQVGGLRNEFKNKIKDKNFENKEQFRQEHQNMITDIKVLRNEFRNRLEANRGEVLAKIIAEKERFRAELGKIKNENKKISVEKIINKLAELNLKITNNLSNLTDKIEAVLLGIESRTKKAESRGLDVSLVQAEIVLAKESIVKARNAILDQSGKSYTLTVIDEDILKEIIKAIRNTFRDDIKATRVEVKLAHEAVRKIAVTLAQIPKIDDDNSTEEESDNNDSVEENDETS